MYIQTLTLENFRQSSQESFRFTDGLNLILGPNGAGKTNLLEAIYILLTSSSFRTNHLSECIRFNSERANLRCIIDDAGWQEKIVCGLNEDRKQFILNGKKVNSTHGQFPVVLWLPEDMQIVRAGPKFRRNYLDLILLSQDPLYIYHLRRYQRGVKLKTAAIKGRQHSSLDAIELEMAKSADYLTKARIGLCQKLQEHFTHALEELEHEGVHQLVYSSQMGMGLEDHTENYLRAWQLSRKQELLAGCCLRGPHLDDLQIYFRQKSARRFASEGQARAIVAALKIAQMKLLCLKQRPWLLIDELGIGFDKRRWAAIWKMMQGWQQAFITSPDTHYHILQEQLASMHNSKAAQEIYMSAEALTCN